MSRYNKQHDGNIVSWGYDHALGYFIDEYTSEDEPVFDISSYCVLVPHPDYPHKMSYSRAELLALFQEYDIPQEHIDLLVLDLPF